MWATLDHLIGATWMFTLANQDQVVREDAGSIGDDDPADAAAMTNLSEVVVHTWDIATAVGADGAFGAEIPIDP